MTNDEMKEGRFARWADARRRLGEIQRTLAAGGRVMVATCGKATVYGQKHFEMFRATKTGLVVRRGKSWDCIDYCAIRHNA